MFGIISSIHAQTDNPLFIHSFSNSIGMSLEGGITYSVTDFSKNRYNYLGRGLLEYFFYSNSVGTFGLRFHGGISHLGGQNGVKLPNENFASLKSLNTSVYYFGGGYSYTLALGNLIHPYAFIGLSYIVFDPRGDDNIKISTLTENNFAKQEINYDGEIGLRFLIHENFSVNLSATGHLNPSDNLDGVWGNDNNDYYYSANLGLSYYFLHAKDSDGDGVDDSEDLCPNTLPHYIVDDFGCPLDSDKDGVLNDKDLCPETPRFVVVDENGCAVDLDKDGVLDSLDQCLYTPIGIEVDSLGCPLDSDNDGIPNTLDQCQQTPQGIQVDSVGCPVIVENDTSFRKLIINNFSFGGVELPVGAELKLEKLINYMLENPKYKWSIEGHSDSIAVDRENNYELSVKRSKVVFDYLVRNGINHNKLTILGFSNFRPAANNYSSTGRALNRRVEIIKLN